MLNLPFSKSVTIILVIKYPLITKKTSTPRNPPLNSSYFEWYKSTPKTEIPLREVIDFE